ncbi:MAG TPA: biopolymer transporter ExbD [Gemmatimonadales bacterium]|nr:biopolymer transporter ExbD [Gemmatimonadales bacterium]
MGAPVGGSEELKNEPNVVPMIDVMLVLLIIFMMIIPMSRKAIDVQLPDPNPQVPVAPTESNQIVLEVLADGSYQINSQPVAAGGLDQRLREIYDPRPDKIIFVKGDPTLKFQEVVKAMDIARGAGVKVIGVPPK